jgi:phosphoribosylaminoimidazolecarboxamide formyltransferase/IMP cyclohydrolase
MEKIRISQPVFMVISDSLFTQLNGKELSYNNLVDVDAAIQLINEFTDTSFAIIKHTNVCGVAQRPTVKASWDAALAGDPESAFGGVLVTNGTVDVDTAHAIHEIFFEVLIAPAFEPAAIEVLSSKKNRILLALKTAKKNNSIQSRSLLNGTLSQEQDTVNYSEWTEVGGRETSPAEKEDLIFANLVCKHLKSNAIALVKTNNYVEKDAGKPVASIHCAKQ